MINKPFQRKKLKENGTSGLAMEFFDEHDEWSA